MLIWNTRGRQWTAEAIAALRQEVSAYQDRRDAEFMHAYTHVDSRCPRCLAVTGCAEELQLVREWATAQLHGQIA